MLKAISDICRIVEHKNTMPILADIRIISEDSGQVKFTGTDLDIALTTYSHTPTAGFPDDGICVPAKALQAAAKAIGPGASLRYEGEAVTVYNDAQEIRLKLTLPGSDFPCAPELDTHWSSAPCPVGAALLSALKYCYAAVSTEERRYYLNGVCLQTKGDLWAMIATDGHRLRCVKADAGMAHGAHDNSYIIPRKTVKTLLDIKRTVKHVFIRPDSVWCIFVFDDGSFMESKLIDGSFPEWERVVPNGEGDIATFTDRKAALKTIKGMISFIGKGAPVKIESHDAGLQLTMQNDETDMASTFDGTYEGEAFGLNATHLMQEIADCEDELKLIVKSPCGPVITVHSGDCQRFGIVMPLRREA